MYIFNETDIVLTAEVRNLGALRYYGDVDAFYAMYVTTESEGRQRVFSFKTDGKGFNGSGHQASFTAVIAGPIDVYRTEDVVVEIWIERDDGLDSPDSADPGWKVLEGKIER